MVDITREIKEALTEAEKPSELFEALRNGEELSEVLPELTALIGVLQNPEYHPEGDAWNHTMLVLDEAAQLKGGAKNTVGFMYAALCHDFGKAISTTCTDGRIRSIGHEKTGVPLASACLKRLGVDRETREYVLNMVKLHMRPHALTGQNSGSKAFARLFGESLCPQDLVLLAKADRMGQLRERNIAEEARLHAELEAYLQAQE